ncbi:unnamed protein product, partial [Prorocentrum cordatum]
AAACGPVSAQVFCLAPLATSVCGPGVLRRGTTARVAGERGKKEGGVRRAHGATRPRAVACARPAGGRALSPAASRRRGAPPRRHARPPPACAGVGCTTEAASAASRSPAGDFRHEAKARVCPPPT